MIYETLWMLRYVGRSLRGRASSWRRDLAAWRRFWGSYQRYSMLAPPDGRPSLGHLYPCLGDDSSETPVEPIYYYQDAWAFEHIVKEGPAWHVDVGSHHKFVVLLSKVVSVIMVDIRPLSLPMDGLSYRQGSILDLPFADASVPSLSSLCVVEHVGLGRYGDDLDPHGSEKAIGELKRVLAPGGHLYLSVPVGDHNIVAFNGGRILRLDYVMDLVHPLVISQQKFIVGRKFQDTYQRSPMFGTTGLFELVKPQTTSVKD